MVANRPAVHRLRGHPAATIAAVVVATLLLSGCYTMLHHPSSEVAMSEYTGECLRCHTAAGEQISHHRPWVEYYSYSSTPWINYYASPWWIDWTWEPTPPGVSGGGAGEAGEEPSGSPAPSEHRNRRLSWGLVPRDLDKSVEAVPRSDIERNPTPIPGPSGGSASPPSVPVAPGVGATEPSPSEESQKAEEPKPKTLPSSGRSIRR